MLLILAGTLDCSAADWRPALPGWQYEFPRDHHLHSEFKTEWWYFTGRLDGEKGEIFGYELTFFRQGLRPPEARAGTTSRFVVDDLKFAHFAISDIHAQQFHFQQELSRGAFDEAGFGTTDRLAWIDGCSLELASDGTFALRANDGSASLQLHLESVKPFAIHGENGISQKADGAGRASHYFSATRLATSGTLGLGGKSIKVSGESWLDREWASNQLAANQVGWNWFSLQFDDGTELMLYQMRTKDGGLDPNSSGTFVARDGATQHLRRDDYQLTPHEVLDQQSHRRPLPHRMATRRPRAEPPVPHHDALGSAGTRAAPCRVLGGLDRRARQPGGRQARGHGYLELTGYAGALVGLSER